jgi:DNA (cytosine-5)-methyltransferase 1
MLKVLDLFSGLGAFSLGLERAGMRTVAFCDNDPWCHKILRAHWRGVPIFDDVTTLKGIHVGPVDVIAAGFPCQDASSANPFGLGIAGERTGLFYQVIRLARELRPRFIILENVPELLDRGFGHVLRALAEIGHDAEWDCLSLGALGAPHERERLWVVSYPSGSGWQGSQPNHGIFERAKAALAKHGHEAFELWRQLVSGELPLRGVDGATVTMERRRLHAIGNSLGAVIPQHLGRAILAAHADAQLKSPEGDTAVTASKSIGLTPNYTSEAA